jgi:protein associated with RNAse G/E
VSSPNRIKNLLTQLHLENRFIMDASALNYLEMDIDFTIANDNLNIIRKSSKDFLEDALGVM